MYDFTTPTEITLPSLYFPSSTPTPGTSKGQWATHERYYQDENIDPSSIATVMDSYASSKPYGRPRSHSFSIGIGYPSTAITKSTAQRAPRTPLSIRIPNVAPLNPIRRRIVNAHCPPGSPLVRTASIAPISRTTPSLQAVSDWVIAAQRRARDSREQRSKLVAAKLLALHNKPPRIRFPPSEVPRRYVKSSLSQMAFLDLDDY